MTQGTSRRTFLKQGSVGLAAATQLGWFAHSANAAITEDYRALVCILLAGGADSFNMLVPQDQDRYDEYAATRADLALPRADLVPLNYVGGDGQAFGVHPGLASLQTLFDGGDLAFVANIGPLAEPTTRAAYDAGTARLPLGLFSHADQIAVWQTGAAGVRINSGFGGRLADLVQPQVTPGPVSMNISMSGTNLFQSGVSVASYALDPIEGVRSVAGYGEDLGFSGALDQVLAQAQAGPFQRSYAQALRGAIDAGIEVENALAQAPTFATDFSDGPLSAALAQVARVMSVREQFDTVRQTFFITIGGWDHHDEVLVNQSNMLPGIAAGLSEFHAALAELGLSDQVVTFTISDFGRTLTSNGRGSDHGWGGNNIVMGGALNGGAIHGEYPSLALDTTLDLGRGRLLPTTSTDVFYAELALWFGVEPAELPLVLPNIGRFYDASSDPLPLGLFA